MPKSKLLGTIAGISKQKIIPATVVDSIGKYLAVKLGARGSKLHGVKYIGTQPQIGDTVYINYQNGVPIAYTTTELEIIPETDTGQVTSSGVVPPLETPPSLTQSHNDLSGIQGGTPPTEFYHLTSDEYDVYGSHLVYVDLSDQIDGSNKSFLIGGVAYMCVCFWNGLASTPVEATLNGTKTRVITTFTPQIGDTLTVAYWKNTIAFTPPVLPEIPESNLVFVFAADQISDLDDGDEVATWIDAGPFSLTCMAEETYRPIYKTNILNSLPVVRFNNAEAMKILGVGPRIPTAAHLFIVATLDDEGYYNLYNHSASIDSWWGYSSTNGYIGTFRSARIEEYPASVPFTGTHIFEIRSSATNYIYLLDQVSKGTQSAAYDAGDSTHTIGCDEVYGNPDKFLKGDIAEMILYSSIQSGDDLTTIYTYLTEKYDL